MKEAGALLTILPYYGTFHDWRSLMTLFSRKTHYLWTANPKIFEVLKYQSEVDADKNLIQEVYQSCFRSRVTVDKNFELNLDFINSKSLVFLSKTKSMYFPAFKKLTLRNITSDLTEPQGIVNAFLNDKTLFKNIEVFEVASRYYTPITRL